MLSRTCAAMDVGWDQLDKPKFYAFSAIGLLVARSAVYPMTMLKTRMQSGPSGGHGPLVTARNIVRLEGVRGLYRGVREVRCWVVSAADSLSRAAFGHVDGRVADAGRLHHDNGNCSGDVASVRGSSRCASDCGRQVSARDGAHAIEDAPHVTVTQRLVMCNDAWRAH